LRLSAVRPSHGAAELERRVDQAIERIAAGEAPLEVQLRQSATEAASHGTDGQRLFNPGSPTHRRRQPRHTVGRLVLDAGTIVEHEIIPLD